jgi:hypothetical protein
VVIANGASMDADAKKKGENDLGVGRLKKNICSVFMI